MDPSKDWLSVPLSDFDSIGNRSSSEVGTSLMMGSILPWLDEAEVPHFVSDIEFMVRGLSVIVGFPTFRASL